MFRQAIELMFEENENLTKRLLMTGFHRCIDILEVGFFFFNCFYYLCVCCFCVFVANFVSWTSLVMWFCFGFLTFCFVRKNLCILLIYGCIEAF